MNNISRNISRNKYTYILFSIFICAYLTLLVVIKTNKMRPEMTFYLRQNKPMVEDVKKHYEKIHIIGPEETVVAKAYFKLGAYKGSTTEYNYKQYGESKKRINKFLEACTDLFEDNDIVSVDGLKFQKTLAFNYGSANSWKPFPNPPMPVLDKSLDKSNPRNRHDHFRKYSKWINDHPHFGYPPLPMPWVEEEVREARKAREEAKAAPVK